MPSKARPPQPKNTFLYLVITALLISAFVMIFNPGEPQAEQINLNKFVEEVESGRIESIEVADNRINIELVDGTLLYTLKEPTSSVYDLLSQAGIEQDVLNELPLQVVDTQTSRFWTDLLVGLIPFGLIILFFVFMMRSAQSTNNQALSFGKSKAKQYNKEKEKTTFAEVAGADEAKQELEEIVDFLKKPQKYRKIGAKIPKGVILVGAPGTGKTLLARAVAGEAEVPFFSISGSEFVEMFVGVGASRVRDLFNKAKRNSPCIIFIDEIDAVGRHRGAGMGGGHDEREQTLNQILTEMDGFETGTNVIIIAATNRPDILDPALLRPGRFDRKVTVDMPDVQARKEILKVHARNKPIDKDVDLASIARGTPGFSGADLENLLNEAAILAARHDKKSINNKDINESIEKVALGPEKKSKIISDKEKELTAYHELGHAIIGHLLPGCDPIHKVSIIPRGRAGGVTWSRPIEDKSYTFKSQFEDQLCMTLGGFAAEELFFGETTTGPYSDLKKATKLAKAMVTKFGMSELGPMALTTENDEVFLGKDFGHVKEYSEKSAAKIDELAREYILKAHERAKEILEKNKKLMEKIAVDLLKLETLSEKEFAEYFTKKNHKKPKQPPKK